MRRAAALGLLAVALAAAPAGAASGPARATRVGPASPALLRAVTGVPDRVFNRVGAGSASPAVVRRVGAGGFVLRPRVVVLTARRCPRCAAASWPQVLALSRFGTLRRLGRLTAGVRHVRGLSLLHARYDSHWLRLAAVTRPAGAASRALRAVDPGLTPPLAALGGPTGAVGTAVAPSVVAGASWRRIAARLRRPSTRTARAIAGEANLLTAALCRATRTEPQVVCRSTGVRASAALLPPS